MPVRRVSPHPTRHPAGRHRAARLQRGAAALVVTMLLFFAMVLVALFVNRNLVFEQRSSANQYRSTQAFEAAEAGQEWALAQLNHNERLGPDCLPSSDPAATTFRERYLSYHPADASFTPTTWANAGTTTPLQPGCVRGPSGWSCSCPAQSAPTLAAPSGNGGFPAFTLQFLAGGKPGVVRVIAAGCTSLAGACRPGSSTKADATAHIEVSLGLLAALRTPPAAALTLRGAFDANTAPLGIRNPDPATGLGIHAGGSISAGQARLTPPAGASTAGMLVGNDAALANSGTDAFFASYFGMSKAAWKGQPAVRRIDCSGECTSTLVEAVGTGTLNAMVWVHGDLLVTGPVTLGSAQHPVVVIVDGNARFSGATVIHGVVYAASLAWNDNAVPGALLGGALLSEGGYQGDAATELFYDTQALAMLQRGTGSFTRVSGSWHDF